MKNKTILLTALLPMLFLAGCTGQPSTAAPTTAAPAAVPEIPIPEVIQKDPINSGEAYQIDWSDDGNKLAVEINNQINIYSSQDGRLIESYIVNGLSPYDPFAYRNEQIIGYFTDGEPAFRVFDLTSKQFTQTYTMPEMDNVISVNYEQMLYVSENYSCHFHITNICKRGFSLHHILDESQEFNFLLQEDDMRADGPTILFSHDGKFLITTTGSNRLLVWNTQTEELVLATDVDSRITSVDFSKDARLMLTAGNDGTARVWDIESGIEISRIDHFTNGLYYVQFLNNDQEILVGTQGQEFFLWSFNDNTGKTAKISDLFSVEEPGMLWGENQFPEIETSSDEQHLAIESGNRVILKGLTGDRREIILPGYNGAVLQKIFSEDGKMMAVADIDQILIYGLQPYRYIATFPEVISESQLLYFIPHTNRFLAATDGYFYDWNFETGQIVSYKFSEDNPCQSPILAISHNGAIYLSDGVGEIKVCSTFTHQMIKEILISPDEYYSFYRISEDKSELIAISSSRLVRMNLDTGEIIAEIPIPYITTPNDQSFQNNTFSFFDNDENNIKLMNLQDGSIKSKVGYGEFFSSVILSPNLRLVALRQSENVTLLDSQNGNVLFSIDMSNLESVLFNPVLNEFYTIKDGTITPWDYTGISDPNLYDQFFAPTPEPLSIPCLSGEEPEPGSPPSPTLPAPEPAPTRENIQLKIPVANDVISANNVQKLVVDLEIGKGSGRFSALSEDGKILAVSNYTEVDLYNVKQGTQLQSIPLTPGQWVISFGFNSDHSLLAMQLVSSEIQIWSIKERTRLGLFTDGHCWSPTLTFSDDNQTLTSICSSYTEKWDIGTGKLLQSQANDGTSLQSSEGDLQLARYENGIRLLNRQDEIVKTIEYKNDWPAKYFLSPDNQLLFIGFVDSISSTITEPQNNAIAQIWDVSNPESIHLLSSSEFTYSVESYDPLPIYMPVSFTRDNRNLILCLDQAQVTIHDTASGKIISKIPGSSDCRLYRNNTQIITQDFAGNISIWDVQNVRSPRLIWQVTENNASADGFQYGVNSNELLTYNSSMFYTTQLTNSQIAHKTETISIPAAVITAADPNGRWLAYMTDRDIYVLDREQAGGDWVSIYTLKSNSPFGLSDQLAFSADGHQLAAAMNDGHLWIKNLLTNSYFFLEEDRISTRLLFSPDGKTLLSMGYNQGIFWNTETGQKLYSMEELGDRQVFHPNGKMLITVDQDALQLSLIAYPSGTVIKTIPLQAYADNIALAPDGKTLALMNLDSTDFIDLETDEYLAKINKRVLYLDFAPDGKSMATYLWGGLSLTWKVGE